jgi:type 1 glutamine amidotransferase
MTRALVLCDDLWHPGEIVIKGMDALAGDAFAFDYVMDAKDTLTPKRIAEYPVVINCKCNNITAANTAPWFEPGVTEVMPEDFEAYVRAGGGFLAVHSGNAFYKENDCAAYTEFVGNYFVRHPPRCDVNVEITARHPVTEGVKNFTLRDEHYEIVLTATDAQNLFVATSAAGGRQVGGYVREPGAGRLCALMPGHTLDAWLHPEYRKMMINAIRWCAKL